MQPRAKQARAHRGGHGGLSLGGRAALRLDAVSACHGKRKKLGARIFPSFACRTTSRKVEMRKWRWGFGIYGNGGGSYCVSMQWGLAGGQFSQIWAKNASTPPCLVRLKCGL